MLPGAMHKEGRGVESALYEKKADLETVCRTCSHYCRISAGEKGRCGVRENRDGQLCFLAYDRVVAAAADPIEKKPIYHFKPGSLCYSIAAPGCNFTCDFCQNADIAQMPVTGKGRLQGQALSPGHLVSKALAAGCESMAFTYTEPTVFFELARDTAALAKDAGLATVFVTNGFMSPDLISAMNGLLDAANVDLKSFDPQFYRQYCGGRLGPVKENLKAMVRAGILVEVTTLVIPGLNDDPHELEAMARFICGELGPDTPWHLSRFHPGFRMTDRDPTPVSAIETAIEKGCTAGLNHVYAGNLPGHPGENTLCAACGAVVITRRGYQTRSRLGEKGRCPDCGHHCHGIFN